MQKTNYYSPISVRDFVCSSYGTHNYKIFLNNDKGDGVDNLRMERIKFHIENDEYFVVLATILNVIASENKEGKEVNNIQNNILGELHDDLIYLQKNYQIVKK